MITKSSNLIVTTILKAFFLSLLCLANLFTANAQINQPQDVLFDSPQSPITCEGWLNYLGRTLQEWEKEWKKNNNSSLIVIARLGDKESRRVNLTRVKTLKEYILAPRWKVKAVFAEGERVKGFGVIELYIEGKLFYSLPLQQKADIPLRICY